MTRHLRAVLLGAWWGAFPALCLPAVADEPVPSFAEYLRHSAVSRELIDRFLAGPSWAQFDPELGYILGNYLPVDGIDGSATISTVQPNGARTSLVYADRPCRINTYGDSFTQCHQVSDAETWQEYLAGHLGEPIRNFGMGGYGVYQAYRRLLREERGEFAARYVIFYIWGDDHVRSLLRCRHAHIYPHWDHQGGRMFHNNFWPYVEMDLATGHWMERDNLLPTRESLYRMTDPEWMVEHLRDDLALQLSLFKAGQIADLDEPRVAQLAARLGCPWEAADAAQGRPQAAQLLDRYALQATRYVLGRLRDATQQNGNQLLVVLFDPYRVLPELCRQGTRYDQEIVEYLAAEGIRSFDMNVVHARDWRASGLPYDQYVRQFFIGHYNPRGNHFFAYAIKDTVVQWLDPKPLPYRPLDPHTVDFRGYLEAYR
ncbi:MAG: hypothetical protein MUF48_19015 [Pirellulaceae bacterium]|jgi:hypothetical protein|nr:hypothetical protein [Pirellulaceae bacterium]